MAIVKKTKKSAPGASRSTPKKPKATAPKSSDTESANDGGGSGGGDDDDGNGRSTSLGLEIDDEVLEFIEALDRFKKSNNRPFPSWSEVLHVLKELGYKKG